MKAVYITEVGSADAVEFRAVPDPPRVDTSRSLGEQVRRLDLDNYLRNVLLRLRRMTRCSQDIAQLARDALHFADDEIEAFDQTRLMQIVP